MNVKGIEVCYQITSNYIDVSYFDGKGNYLPEFEEGCQVEFKLFGIPLHITSPNDYKSVDDVNKVIKIFIHMYNKRYQFRMLFEPIDCLCKELNTIYDKIVTILHNNHYEITSFTWGYFEHTCKNPLLLDYVQTLYDSHIRLQQILGNLIWVETMTAPKSNVVSLTKGD